MKERTNQLESELKACGAEANKWQEEAMKLDK